MSNRDGGGMREPSEGQFGIPALAAAGQFGRTAYQSLCLPPEERDAMESLDVTASSHRARIRVLIIAQERIFAEAIGTVLSADPELAVIGIYTPPLLAVEGTDGTRPDLVVLAYSDSAAEIAQIITSLRTRSPEIKIILLAMDLDQDVLSAAVAGGAVGYLSIPRCGIMELIGSIKRAHNGEMVFSTEMLVNLLKQPRPRQPTQPLGRRE